MIIPMMMGRIRTMHQNITTQLTKAFGEFMKHIMTTLLFSTLLIFGAPIMAGTGHEHDTGGGHSHGPVSSDEVTKRATKKIKQLAKAGKIDNSWIDIKAKNVEQKTFSKGPEWLISFKNDTIKEAGKQTLYFFYSLDGHYIAANYTGK